MLVCVNQLAGINPLAKDFDLAAPFNWNYVGVPNTQALGQGLESGIGHLINITNRSIRNGSHSAKCAMNIGVDLTPK